jgi:hypothetical protein
MVYKCGWIWKRIDLVKISGSGQKQDLAKKKKGGFDRISPSDAKFSFLCDVTGTSNVVKLKFVCGCQA